MNTPDRPRKKRPTDLDPDTLEPFPMTAQDRIEFGDGVKLFNAGRFWDAHEKWEEVWRRHTEDSRMFLQGLIQAAAAFHTLVEKGNAGGALRNLAKSIPRLALFEPEFLGVAVEPLVAALRRIRDQLREQEADHPAVSPAASAPSILWRPPR
jgi:predicted metal-dependent hydrolase